MRQNQIANASLNPDGVNLDGESAGMNGDNKKLAGARRTVVINPETGLPEYGRCTSLMGGCQGAPIRQDDVRSSFFGFSYAAGSWQDRINESFAGPHDWFRNLTGSYDALGNSRNFTGFRAFVDDYIMNYGLVIPAAPFAAAALTPSYLYESPQKCPFKLDRPTVSIYIAKQLLIESFTSFIASDLT
jgi:hypothetical protein